MATKREPYVGPRPFEEKDEEVFFGRDQEVDELVSLVCAHQATLLYAQSGVGKTSLLKASLIPTLVREEQLEVLPPARVRSQGAAGKVDNIYVYNALDYLSKGKLGAKQRAKMTLGEFLRARKQPERKMFDLLRRTSQHVEFNEVPSLCVVIFDQFEEFFTTYPERYEDRQIFFDQMREALEADKLLRAVFAMREDYIAQLDPYVATLPEKLRTRYRLEPLRERTALAAIRGPLKNKSYDGIYRSFAEGKEGEEDVAETLVKNLRTIQVKTPSGQKEVLGEFVDTVQLQVVCQTLWRKLEPEDTIITHEHLKKYGDVSEALANFYETCIRDAALKAGINEADLRVWFERTLITAAGKRGMVYRGQNDPRVGGTPCAAVDELEDQHIIRAELRNDERWYELSHDRFIQPILESNRKWLRAQPLAEQKRLDLEGKAAAWIRARRDRSVLLDGAEMRDAGEWLASPEAASVGYSQELELFVEASRTAQQQRRARQMRLAFAGVVMVTILMVGLTAFAFQQRSEAVAQTNRANAQTELARLNEAEAVKASKESVEAREAAIAARKKAEENADFALQQEKLAKKNAEEAKRQGDLARQQERLAETETKRANEQAAEARRQQSAALTAKEEADKQRRLAEEQKEIVEEQNKSLTKARDELKQALADAQAARENAERQVQIANGALKEAKEAKQAAEENLRKYTEVKEVGALKDEAFRLEQNNDLKGALDFYQRALNVYQQSGDRAGQISVLEGIGRIQNNMGDYDSSLQSYRTALSLLDQDDLAGKSRILSSIGFGYLNQQKTAEALSTFQEAFAISGSIQDSRGKYEALYGTAVTRLSRKEYAEADDALDGALKLAEKLNDQYGIATVYQNYGWLKSDKGDYKEAVDYYLKALEMYEKQGGAFSSQALVLDKLISAYKRIGKTSEVEKYTQMLRALQSAPKR